MPGPVAPLPQFDTPPRRVISVRTKWPTSKSLGAPKRLSPQGARPRNSRQTFSSQARRSASQAARDHGGHPWEGDLARELKERFSDRIAETSTYLGQNFIVAKPEAAVPSSNT